MMKNGEFLNKNISTTYPSPFYAFKEFTPEKCGEFYDILYFLDLHTNELSEVKRLISKSKWIKIL